MLDQKVWRKFKKNKGALWSLLILFIILIVAIFAPWIAPYKPTDTFGTYKLPPIWSVGGQWIHLLGTDDLGRDLLSRLIYGARFSLGVGCLVVLMAMTTGVVLGLLAGYVGGVVDAVIMRLVDIIMSLPSILLAIVVVSILGPNLFNGVVAVSVVALPGFIRIVRANVMAEKAKLYVSAATNFGASPLRNMFIHILPNCMAPIVVQSTLGFSDGILNVAALGFLGLGAQPPTPEWGVMLADARAYIESASWLVTLPGLCILVVVLCFNLLGDGLRDSFDPKL